MAFPPLLCFAVCSSEKRNEKHFPHYSRFSFDDTALVYSFDTIYFIFFGGWEMREMQLFELSFIDFFLFEL